MNKDEPLSPLQKTQEALRFRATRKTYWDKLDQYVFGRLFDNHWPSLSQQDKQSCLAQTLNDLFLVERMLPEIQNGSSLRPVGSVPRHSHRAPSLVFRSC